MTAPAFIVSSLLLLFFGIYIGFISGARIAGDLRTAGAYWWANLACIVVATIAFALLGAVPLFYSAVAGLLAGSLVGLKMGFGDSVGPWRKVDQVFHVGEGRRARGRRADAHTSCGSRTGADKERDLISVPDHEAPGADEADRRRRATRQPEHPAGNPGRRRHTRRGE